MSESNERFRRAAADAFRPIHQDLDAAVRQLAGHGTARTYFNAREAILLIWLERAESTAEGGK